MLEQPPSERLVWSTGDNSNNGVDDDDGDDDGDDDHDDDHDDGDDDHDNDPKTRNYQRWEGRGDAACNHWKEDGVDERLQM